MPFCCFSFSSELKVVFLRKTFPWLSQHN
jgi:hypothetical protein